MLLAGDLSRRWTLAEIAAEIKGSPVYLTQVFQQVEGMPLYRYHLRLRLAPTSCARPAPSERSAPEAGMVRPCPTPHVISVLRVAGAVFSKTGKCLGLRAPRPPPDCWDGPGAATLDPRPKNKRPETLGRSAGPQDRATEEHRGSKRSDVDFLPAHRNHDSVFSRRQSAPGLYPID